jgi:hypothetical protein
MYSRRLKDMEFLRMRLLIDWSGLILALCRILRAHFQGPFNNLSPKDLLLKLSRVYKTKIKNNWYLAEINSKSLKLFQIIDISVT